MHSLHMGETAPKEPGQAAFVAIQEVVQILEADPTTDWSTVNIDALREHLQDMDNVTMRAVVDRQNIPGGARFTITGDPATAASVERMVRAQTGMLGEIGEFDFVFERIQDGAVWTVTSADKTDETKIRGLGFFGLITGGGHHQAHHLALARGQMPH